MNRILIGVAALALAGTYVASADVLVMQDGRRIRGELVSVNRGTVLFDEIREGSANKRRMRVNKDDVARIDLRDSARGDDDLDTMDDVPSGPGPGRDRGRAGRPDDGGYGRDRDTTTDSETDSGPFGRNRDGGRVVEPPDLGREGGVSGRDRVVTVAARQAWTDTAIDVTTGDVIRFQAEGTVARGPGQEDGPAGEMNSPINDRRPIPARPAGALIGRIGTSPSDVFFIGDDRGGFRVRTSGRLYLGVNDNFFGDNTGSFQVRVSR